MTSGKLINLSEPRCFLLLNGIIKLPADNLCRLLKIIQQSPGVSWAFNRRTAWPHFCKYRNTTLSPVPGFLLSWYASIWWKQNCSGRKTQGERGSVCLYCQSVVIIPDQHGASCSQSWPCPGPRILLFKEQLKVCLCYSFSAFGMDFRAIAWPGIDLCLHVSLSLSPRSPEPVAILQDPTLEIKFQRNYSKFD